MKRPSPESVCTVKSEEKILGGRKILNILFKNISTISFVKIKNCKFVVYVTKVTHKKSQPGVGI